MHWTKRNKEVSILRGAGFSAHVHKYKDEWWGTLFAKGETKRITPTNSIDNAKAEIEKLLNTTKD